MILIACLGQNAINIYDFDDFCWRAFDSYPGGLLELARSLQGACKHVAWRSQGRRKDLARMSHGGRKEVARMSTHKVTKARWGHAKTRLGSPRPQWKPSWRKLKLISQGGEGGTGETGIVVRGVGVQAAAGEVG